MRKQRREKNEKTEVVPGTKKWRKQRKAGKVQPVIDGGDVQLGPERPGRCQQSPLRKKIQVCLRDLCCTRQHTFTAVVPLDLNIVNSTQKCT